MPYASAQVAQDIHLRGFPSITPSVVAGQTDVVQLYLCSCMGHVVSPSPLPLAFKLTATIRSEMSQHYGLLCKKLAEFAN